MRGNLVVDAHLEHGLLKVDTVSLGHEARQRERRQVASHADTHRDRRVVAEPAQVEHSIGRQTSDTIERPARLVNFATAVMVGLAHRVEERREFIVVLRIHRVAADPRVVVILREERG